MDKIKLPNGKLATSFIADDNSELAIVHLSVLQRLTLMLKSAKLGDIIAAFLEMIQLNLSAGNITTLEAYVALLKSEVAFHESVNLIKVYDPNAETLGAAEAPEQDDTSSSTYWVDLFKFKSDTHSPNTHKSVVMSVIELMFKKFNKYEDIFMIQYIIHHLDRRTLSFIVEYLLENNKFQWMFEANIYYYIIKLGHGDLLPDSIMSAVMPDSGKVYKEKFYEGGEVVESSNKTETHMGVDYSLDDTEHQLG